MYTLYSCPGTCSSALHVVLKETGAPYTFKKVSLKDGDTRTPEYLAMNPRGQVPVLVVEGAPVVEGAGLVLYLLEKYDTTLLPAVGTLARAQALQWFCFANATLHTAHFPLFFPSRYAQSEATQAEVAEMARQRVQMLWEQVEASLPETGPFFAGEKGYIGEILLSIIANWTRGVKPAINLGPKTERMIRAAVQRPSFQAVLAEEQFQHFAQAA